MSDYTDDRGTIRRRLRHAQSHRLMVAVLRRGDLPRLYGFVVGLGLTWVALATLDEREMIDGWSLVRLKTVTTLRVEPDPDCFEVRVLKARSQWPPATLDAPLDKLTKILDWAQQHEAILSVHTTSECFLVGRVKSVGRRRVHFRTISYRGRWQRKPRSHRLADITRIDVGDGYAQTLLSLAEAGGAGETPQHGQGNADVVKGKASIAEQLTRAQQEQSYVRLRRRIPDSDVLDGFVCGVGKEWVAVATLTSTWFADGWVFLRRGDLRKVKVLEAGESRASRILKARSQWPPESPRVNLDELSDLLRSVPERTLVGFHLEKTDPDRCWIGSVQSLDGGVLTLDPVDARGLWEGRPRHFDVEEVTRLEVGGGYHENLGLVADPRGSSELASLRSALHVALETEPTQARQVIIDLVARECSAFVARGGTIDELAVELALGRSAVDDLLSGSFPEHR